MTPHLIEVNKNSGNIYKKTIRLKQNFGFSGKCQQLTLADVPSGERGRPYGRGCSRWCAGPARQKDNKDNISEHQPTNPRRKYEREKI